MAETTVKPPTEDRLALTEDEIAGAIAYLLAQEKETFVGLPVQGVIRDLLLRLPDPPEPEAAEEAARMILLVEAADGQKLR